MRLSFEKTKERIVAFVSHLDIPYASFDSSHLGLTFGRNIHDPQGINPNVLVFVISTT